MTLSPTSETALIVIAAATALQALLTLVVAIGVFVAVRRFEGAVGSQIDGLTARLDAVAAELRSTLRSVDRAVDGTSEVIHATGGVLRSVGAVVDAPRALALRGILALTRRMMGRRRTA